MPRPDVSEERTQQILEAAVTAFVQLGMANTRMEDIAQAAGLSKGTIYLYFKSKEELIFAILDSFLARELAYAHELLTADLSVAEKINKLADIVAADMAQIKPMTPLYMEFIAQAARDESVRAILQKPFHEFLNVFSALLEQGMANGEFRALNVKEVALTMATLIDGAILLWVYDPEFVDLEQQMKASLQLLLISLMA
jgi:TetR/AcrR family acrAB operon transcriptional repressor